MRSSAAKVVLVDFWTLHLHQLAAHAALCPRLGREVPRSRTGGDRRAYAGVRLREEPGQRPPRREAFAGRLSGRGRQRACHLARLQEPALAGATISSMRRAASGIVCFGEGSYEQSEMVIQQLLAEAGATEHQREPAIGRRPRCRSRCRLENPEVSENYVGYHADASNFTSPGGVVRDMPHVYALPARLLLNQWALSGDWTVKSEPAAAEQAERTHRVPFSCSRSSSRHGTGSAGQHRCAFAC